MKAILQLSVIFCNVSITKIISNLKVKKKSVLFKRKVSFLNAKCTVYSAPDLNISPAKGHF